MALKTMIEQLRQSQKQLNTEARTRIASELGKLLPEGCRLTWNQYTDYFNDGEPCTFSVHEWFLTTKEGNRIESYGYHGYPSRLPYENTITALNDAWRTLSKSEELFQSAFGDHVSVTVHPDGRCETEECDHE